VKHGVFKRAFKYSIPVLLGYLAIGAAFGLMLTGKSYPWYLAVLMSIVMYAGSGQYLAVSLFASGAGITELILAEFVLNARHIAYSISMLKKFKNTGKYKAYLIFALTDETFALLSSMDETQEWGKPEERNKFMFYVSFLNQVYWVSGSLIGALAGVVLPLGTEGIDFALTALFIVLLIEQIIRTRKAAPFIISSLITILAVVFLPKNISLVSAAALSLVFVHIINHIPRGKKC
jgi:4-azaleucine resistance transporter AzlC